MFTKDDTYKIKAIAIMLMLYHHLFCFIDRINISRDIKYIPLIKYNNFDSAYFISIFGKICVAIFIFSIWIWII